MSTVGYGDVITKTALGKMISVFASVLGVLMFSLPIAIFTKNFNDYFVYLLKKEKTAKNIKRKEACKQIKKESVLRWLGRKSSAFSLSGDGRKLSAGALSSIFKS